MVGTNIPREVPPADLLVVVPVYNEERSVEEVIREWWNALIPLAPAFQMLVIDDGSQDGTLFVLTKLREELDSRLEILTRENRGHGQTCLQGYRMAVARNIPHVLQIDSDGQCDPAFFAQFWKMRDAFDVIYGVRRTRDDGFKRTLVSHVLRASLLLWTGVNCADANVPYRLMKTSVLPGLLARIPSTFFLTNIALAVLLRRQPGIKQATVLIHFRKRAGGEPSLRMSRFGGKAVQLRRQLRDLSG